MTRKLTLGFSPCPNDTFIFYALVHGLVPLQQVSFQAPVLEDVETLNSMALKADLDVTKLSFHALGHMLDKYVMLSSGAALGRGCGPLLVTRPGMDIDLEKASIAIPGAYTTAAMLLRLYEPGVKEPEIMRFEEIMPAVAEGQVDAGVIIHESRFTYQELGLMQVEDLGQWWESKTGLPIPLGCIAAKRDLPDEVIREADSAIRESLLWAREHPQQCLEYIRAHSQEMQDSVLQSHISLYVNDFSVHICEEGRNAVLELFRLGREAGIFPENTNTGIFID